MNHTTQMNVLLVTINVPNVKTEPTITVLNVTSDISSKIRLVILALHVLKPKDITVTTMNGNVILVKTNVNPVKTHPTIVLNVPLQDSMPQAVNVQVDIMMTD